jgi:hypothetical protein
MIERIAPCASLGKHFCAEALCSTKHSRGGPYRESIHSNSWSVDASHHSNFLSHHLFHHLPGLPFSFASRAFSPWICKRELYRCAHFDQGVSRTRACIHVSVFPSLNGSIALLSDSRATGTRVLTISVFCPGPNARHAATSVLVYSSCGPFSQTGPGDDQSVRSSADLLCQR